MSRLSNPPQLYARTDCPECGSFGFQERNERRRCGSGWIEERKCTTCKEEYTHRVCDVVAQELDRRYPQVVEQGDLFAALESPLPRPTLPCAEGQNAGQGAPTHHPRAVGEG